MYVMYVYLYMHIYQLSTIAQCKYIMVNETIDKRHMLKSITNICTILYGSVFIIILLHKYFHCIYNTMLGYNKHLKLSPISSLNLFLY